MPNLLEDSRTSIRPADQALRKNVTGWSTGAQILAWIMTGAVFLGGLLWISQHNYLLFHSLAELFSVAVAWAIFMLVWNCRRFITNDALIFLGIAYLFVGLIDLVHTLAYKGMGVFPDRNASNLATQLWIGARIMEAVSLFLFPLLFGRRIRPCGVFAAYGGLTALLLLAIFWQPVFPTCFVEGIGLTPFKKITEYAICGVLAGALLLLWQRRQALDPSVSRLMAAAMGVTIGQELFFTFYVSVYGLSNLIGHFLKIISFFLVYKALIRSGLTRPYSILFRELASKETALRESDIERTAILDAHPDHMVFQDLEHRVLWANASACASVSLSREALTGRFCHEVWAKRSQPCEACPVAMARASGRLEERVMETPDGRIWRVQGVPIRNEQGQIVRMLEVTADITERIHQERQYARILESTMEGFCLTDSQGRILEVNQALTGMLGYSREELLSMHVGDVEALDGPDEISARSESFIREGHARFETRYRRKDGALIDVEVSGAYMPEAGGRFVVFLRDITLQKQNARALEEREAFLRQVIDTSPDCIFVKDWQGRFILVNDVISSLYQTPKEEMLGKTDQELAGMDRLGPEEAERFLADDREVITKQRVKLVAEEPFTLADGVKHWFRTIKVPLNASFAPHCMLGFAVDITEIKQAERERQRLQAQLLQAQKMEAIGTLAGGIAHDFNNILVPILGYAQMALEDAPQESPVRESLQEILCATERARDLIDHILTFSRQSDAEVGPLRLQPIIKEAMKLLRASIPSTIAIQMHIEDDCNPVMANPTEVHQIIMNLATNAYHAMAAEGGTLTLDLVEVELGADHLPEDGMAPGPYVCLKVRDTGMGMSQEVLERVFEPYFTTKPEGKGTGLGLSVVHGIVQACGGHILIESRIQEGTEVRVYLPVIQRPAEERHKVFDQTLRGGSERILLVEDEPVNLKMAQAILERLGYQVSAHTSPLEALGTFTHHPEDFDLIFTDMTMPHLTGARLVEQIRKIRPDIPIVITTGFSEQMNPETARNMGIDGLLMKPAGAPEIAAVIRSVLDQTKDRREG
jgi:PAS domain S-box-containing protein